MGVHRHGNFCRNELRAPPKRAAAHLVSQNLPGVQPAPPPSLRLHANTGSSISVQVRRSYRGRCLKTTAISWALPWCESSPPRKPLNITSGFIKQHQGCSGCWGLSLCCREELQHNDDSVDDVLNQSISCLVF